MVEIIPYQESWPSEFQEIASILRRALGELALRIDHIGSTSIPGLSAKDVIDIQITVADLDHRVTSAMAALGYTRREDIWRDHCPPNGVGPETEWEKLIFLPPLGQRRTRTHVRVQGRANQRYALLFRDYLRAHPASAKAYAELKRRLAQHLADPQTYPEVKDPAVDLIYLAAEDWAAATHWQPGPSDA
ncbi:MAG TPA: GrpB family protein [Anaerolineae bacterium]|nr:GrpB family protein [Anaerolineae bacterium]